MEKITIPLEDNKIVFETFYGFIILCTTYNICGNVKLSPTKYLVNYFFDESDAEKFLFNTALSLNDNHTTNDNRDVID